MSSFGVTAEGFVTKSLQQILQEVQDDELAAFGPETNVQADSVLGQLNGTFADQIAQQWEVQQEVYRSKDPDFATGEALDEVAAITGVIRLGQLPSTVTLELNLDAGTIVTAGSIVSIGANGEQWSIDAEVTNATAFEDTIVATATSLNLGPIIGNATTIDTIITPIAGWSAQAAVNNLAQEPYTLADGETLLVSIDGGADQTITFNTGDFADISNATAAEVASVITIGLSGGTGAVVDTDRVRISSDLNGVGSSVQINGGTAYAALGFSRSLVLGFNDDRPAVTTSGNSQPYTLSDGQTLLVRVDGGGTQTATFNTGDFVDISNATALEVSRVINTDVSGAVAYVAATGRVQIESLTSGINSLIEVAGGAANAQFNFAEAAFQGVSGDADVGRNLETDEELRLRRQQLLRATGAGTLESIKSAVAEVDLVQQVFGFENVTLLTDANGLPGKSFEIVVFGGSDTGIAQAIFDTKPAGIESYRDPGPDGRTEFIINSQGDPVEINFSRPTEIAMYIECDILVDGAVFGGGDLNAGTEQVKTALKDFGDTLTIGDDVIILPFACQPLEVPGVIDTTLMQIEDIDPPTNTSNIIIPLRDIATFSTGRMVVNVTVA